MRGRQAARRCACPACDDVSTQPGTPRVLVVNAGSSSLKLSVVGAGGSAGDRCEIDDWDGSPDAPALRAYLQYRQTDYLPRARTEPGLWSLPEGVECYRGVIRGATSTRLSTVVILGSAARRRE